LVDLVVVVERGAVAFADLSPTSRFTPAAEAHRLTQLFGTPCFFAASATPIRRTSARTAFRSVGVYSRRFLVSILASDRLDHAPVRPEFPCRLRMARC
jgi:hypothetical protein